MAIDIIMSMEVHINGLISANKSLQKCCRRRGKKIEYLKRCHEEKNKLLSKAQALLDEVELKKAEQAKKKAQKAKKA